MAEEFLTLMADLDEESQNRMAEWYDTLRKAGFTGVQTPRLPFHISMGVFALDKEQEVVEEMQRLAKEFSTIPVHISHVGLFPGGRVLFGAPDLGLPDLLQLRNAIKVETKEQFPWTPHATIIIDEPETICRAIPIVMEAFRPFVAKITRLHLCAFWPTREIATVELSDHQI